MGVFSSHSAVVSPTTLAGDATLMEVQSKLESKLAQVCQDVNR